MEAIKHISQQFLQLLGMSVVLIFTLYFLLFELFSYSLPAHAQGLHFAATLPQKALHLKLGKIVADAPAALVKACDKHAPGDAKCACVNHAIFVHDSGFATQGVGKRALNPCNMRIPGTWTPAVGKPGKEHSVNGTFAKFETLADGVDACVETYARFYRDKDASTLVSAWTAGGGNREYRTAVSNCYL